MTTATLYEVRDGAAWITLNQPERRNAVGDVMVAELLAHVDAALADPGVRMLVLTGNGPAFCAGADLKAGGMRPADDGTEPPFVRLLKALWHAPKPVIGRINGHAFGGGLGLVAACDLVVASSAAKFSFSEVRIGVIPAMISVVVLPKIGIHEAMWLFLTGETFDGEHAREIGLVHRVAASEELDTAVRRVIDMVRLGGPNAVAAAKQLVRRVPTMTMDEGLRWTAGVIGGLFASEEAAEGMRAFAEKRPPAWAAKKD